MRPDSGFENTLERLLVESTHSAAARPHFYRELLHATVLICPHGDIADDHSKKGSATLEMAAITHEGIAYVPFYLAEKFLPQGVRYVSLPARTFFEISHGSYLVLNPGDKVSKTFTPEEIAGLLSGQLLDVEREFQVRNNAALLIGKPAEIPAGLLEELSKFFDAESAALRAWLAWYHNPANEKMPGYLLAIETTRSVDFRALAGRVSVVLKAVGTGGHYCDIVRYEGTGLTAYFRSVSPFFSRSWWVRAKSVLLG